MAHIEFLNKEYSKAIYYDKKYIEIDSTYYISYLNLGSDYYHLQKYDSAIYQIKKAINHYNKKRNDKYTIKDLEKYIHISEEKMKTTPNKM